MKTIHVVGAYHADMAWKKGPGEMEELFESFIVRLLDLLERYPGFTYVLEQAAHFRQLLQQRPDLVRRVARYVKEGRLEVVGGMATTMETNIPCGESFVMNQLLGLEWFRRTMGAEVSTGWLIDTFGVNAQVPQLLCQAGIHRLMANRFGGEMTKDLFTAVGLDGSRMTVAGRDVFSPSIAGSRVFFEFTQDWRGIDRLFAMAAEAPGEGPYLLMPYIENEILPSGRIAMDMDALQPGDGFQWSLPRLFFEHVLKNSESLPEYFADLNPEFTGTFSQRIAIRLLNRRAEALLLDAEAWAALLRAGPKGLRDTLDEAWWLMAFNHFHDVFTGSHPTEVFRHVEDNFRHAEAAAVLALREAAGCSPAMEARPGALTVLNTLPRDRHDIISMPAANATGGYRVTKDGIETPSEVHDGRLRFLADVKAAGSAVYLVEDAPASAVSWQPVDKAEIENGYVGLAVSARNGIESLYLVRSGWQALRAAGALMTVQRDDGNFQFEMPAGGEVPVNAGGASLYRMDSPLGQRLKLAWTSKKLRWASAEDMLDWSVELFLPHGKARVEVVICAGWQAEGTRLRLRIPTAVDSSAGIYEIPFGTVARRPYSPGYNKKGEWPAQRFVTLEDGQFGLALVNTGVPGVEVAGGTIWSTLLRAPVSEYAGMVPDGTSSQHGRHDFTFALVPYEGSWADAGVLGHAEELNRPLRALDGICACLPEGRSLLSLAGGTALSAVKLPQDRAPEELIIRVYEPTGRHAAASLHVTGAVQAWRSSILEDRGSVLDCKDGTIPLELKPYEIATVRVNLAVIG